MGSIKTTLTRFKQNRTLLISLFGANAVLFAILLAAAQPKFSTPIIAPRPTHNLYQQIITFEEGQNSHLRLEPQGCVEPIIQINGVEIIIFDKFFCRWPVEIDLSKQLIPGDNQISIKIDEGTFLYLGPKFIGLHKLSAFLTLGLFLSATLFLTALLWKVGFPKIAAALIGAGAIYYLSWLFTSHNLIYTNDLAEHLSYTRYIFKNWLRPYAYVGREAFQPPLYYSTTALVYGISLKLNLTNPLTAIRILSLIYFMIFIGFSIKTFLENTGSDRLTQICGMIQIIFWPTSILFATRINNDIALYACWAAAFYFLTQSNKGITNSAVSLALMGIGLVVKANMATVTLIYLIWLAMDSDRLKPNRDFFLQKQFLAAYAVILACMVLYSLGPLYRYFYFGSVDYHWEWHDSFDLRNFFTVNIHKLLTQPFIKLSKKQIVTPFFEFFLRSIIFGSKSFKYPGLALLTLRIFFCHAVFTGWLLLKLFRQNHKDSRLFLMSVIVPFIFLLFYAVTKGIEYAQDFRFIYPVIVPYIILFTKGLELLQAQKKQVCYWVGVTLGLALPLSSTIFYLAQNF